MYSLGCVEGNLSRSISLLSSVQREKTFFFKILCVEMKIIGCTSKLKNKKTNKNVYTVQTSRHTLSSIL